MKQNQFVFWEKLLNKKNIELKTSVFLVILSSFLCFPIIVEILLNPIQTDAWRVVFIKSQFLFDNLERFQPGSWIAKKVFRLTIPVIIRIFKIGIVEVVLLQISMAFVFLVVCYKLVIRITNDKLQSLFITAGFAFTYVGRAALHDVYTWFDAFAYVFLLLSLYSKNSVVVFIFASLAAWTDERAFIALGLAIWFHSINYSIPKGVHTPLAFLNKRVLGVIFALVFYLVLRFILTVHFGMHTPTDGANAGVLKQTIIYFPIASVTYLEGGWVLVLIMFVLLIYEKNYLFLSFSLLMFLPLLIVSGCVTDMTRSGSYMFILVFISLKILNNKLSKIRMREIAYFCFIISLIFPPLMVCADKTTIQWVEPSSIVYFLNK
jgi:hypothetical protein